MRMTKKILSTVAIIMAIIVLNSCSDDGPDYTKMRVSRMDIAGAKQWALLIAGLGLAPMRSHRDFIKLTQMAIFQR